jgi:hypothetical protein
VAHEPVERVVEDRAVDERQESSFFTVSVSGRSRVPNPPTNTTAFTL